MTMGMQSLARSHSAFNGTVIFRMMPYITYAAAHALEAMEVHWPGKHTNMQTIYLTAPYCTVDVEFVGDDLPTAAQAIQAYWQNRTGDVAKNFDNFAMLPDLAVLAWWDAYLGTRDDSIYENGVPEEIPEGEEGKAPASKK